MAIILKHQPSASDIESDIAKHISEAIKSKVSEALKPIEDKLADATILIEVKGNKKINYSVSGVADSVVQEAESLIRQALRK